MRAGFQIVARCVAGPGVEHPGHAGDALHLLLEQGFVVDQADHAGAEIGAGLEIALVVGLHVIRRPHGHRHREHLVAQPEVLLDRGEVFLLRGALDLAHARVERDLRCGHVSQLRLEEPSLLDPLEPLQAEALEESIGRVDLFGYAHGPDLVHRAQDSSCRSTAATARSATCVSSSLGSRVVTRCNASPGTRNACQNR